jgi:hypothetical protein
MTLYLLYHSFRIELYCKMITRLDLKGWRKTDRGLFAGIHLNGKRNTWQTFYPPLPHVSKGISFMLYRVVQIWPRQTVTSLHTNSPGHIWTTLYLVLAGRSLMTYTLQRGFLLFNRHKTTLNYLYFQYTSSFCFQSPLNGTCDSKTSEGSERMENGGSIQNVSNRKFRFGSPVHVHISCKDLR